MRLFNPGPQAPWEAAAPLRCGSGHPCPQPALLLCGCKVWLLGRSWGEISTSFPITQGLHSSPSPWSSPEWHCSHPGHWARTLDLDPHPDLVTQLPSLIWDLPWHHRFVRWSGPLRGPSQCLRTSLASPAWVLTSLDCSHISEVTALPVLLSHPCSSAEPCAYGTKPN